MPPQAPANVLKQRGRMTDHGSGHGCAGWAARAFASCAKATNPARTWREPDRPTPVHPVGVCRRCTGFQSFEVKSRVEEPGQRPVDSVRFHPALPASSLLGLIGATHLCILPSAALTVCGYVLGSSSP